MDALGETNDQAGGRLLAKMLEVQRLCHGLRSYDGPLEPVVPRIVFQAIFCLPLRCSIHPLENYGVAQRLLNSKDGKYLAVDFGKKPRFWRASPTGDERKATGLLREIREIASRHQVWVTLVDEDGSFFPRQLMPMPGVLYPPPSEPRTVDLEKYLAQIVEETKDEAPGFTERDFSPKEVDFSLFAAAGEEVEIADEEPETCTKCAASLVPSRRQSTPGFEKARDCPACKTIYMRITPESEMTPEQVDEANRRDAMFGEFCRRIEEEFPIPDGADVVGEDEDDSDESWKGESEGD